MPIRQPVVAGRFYPAAPSALRREVQRFLAVQTSGGNSAGGNSAGGGLAAFGCMLPHAGYVYSGAVAGATLSGMKLPRRLIILCPNHTGRGKALGVWPEGAWLTPLGAVAVDESLASSLVASGGGFESDVHSHLGEHSIEVLLPFLQLAQEDAGATLSIAPVCTGTQHPQEIARAGEALAALLARPENADAGLVVSSDMNHYEDLPTTMHKDALALEQALAGDAQGLLQVVAKARISMCGVAPLALALHAARLLGNLRVQLAAHDTSATASGDSAQTVGYAGLRFWLGPRQGQAAQACPTALA